MFNKILSVTFALVLVSNTLLAQDFYQVPPSSSTYGNVPYISDSAMEQCVILYSKAKALEAKINKININDVHVDRYNQTSVNNYNNLVNEYNIKINEYSMMIEEFNQNCAGKQSESAWKAAQKLNSKNQ